MQFLLRRISIGKKYSVSVVTLVWFLLAIVTVLSKLVRGRTAVNNYSIYEGVFWHTVHQTNLYLSYLSEYNDVNHYGPAFSIFIAPFAIFPWWLGCFLWCIANTWFLYFAVKKLPLQPAQQQVILLIAVLELLTSLHNVQFNPMLTAWIILTFVYVDEEKEWAATFFIVAGAFVKIYGIIALVSFLFSRHKGKFIMFSVLWSAVLFCLPMLISSPRFVVQSYIDWYNVLVEKNAENVAGTLTAGPQDISVSGMIRRIFQKPDFQQLWLLVPAGLLYLLPLLRFKNYRSTTFHLFYLALSLITVVIFSSSAESPTYIIAIAGVGIWFVLQPHPYSKWVIALLIFTLLLTSLSSTDLFPRYVRSHFILPYALKALPCFVVWLVLVWQLLTQRFNLEKKQVVVSSIK